MKASMLQKDIAMSPNNFSITETTTAGEDTCDFGRNVSNVSRNSWS